MSEKFLERLREKAELPKCDHPYSPLEKLAFYRGRMAIIQALGGMMIGKPIIIKPSKSVARRIFVQAIEEAATDNGEITVIMFRKEK